MGSPFADCSRARTAHPAPATEWAWRGERGAGAARRACTRARRAQRLKSRPPKGPQGTPLPLTSPAPPVPRTERSKEGRGGTQKELLARAGLPTPGRPLSSTTLRPRMAPLLDPPEGRTFGAGREPEPVSAASYLLSFKEGPAAGTRKPSFGLPVPRPSKGPPTPRHARL